MQLFYNPDLKKHSTDISLDADESRHLLRVLRKKKGDEFKITNGRGRLFTAQITNDNVENTTATIISHDKRHKKMYSLHMAVAPTKSMDRYEWFLEKATEIGVTEITPIICDRSGRKSLKMARLQKVIQTAMKQSLRTYLPVLHEPVSFKEFVEKEHKGILFIAHCEDEEKLELKRRVAPDKRITILIGPEGDFTHSEIKMAKDKGFLSVSLGESRLRTETAAIYACTTIAVLNSR